jgi:hypothetical protein
MRLRAAAAAIVVALGSQSASACLTVDIPPRERFHKATVVLRGTADEIFAFDVVKTWVGNAAKGSRIIAEYDPLGCGSLLAKDGTDYVVYTYEAPTLDDGTLILHHVHLIPAETGKQAISFLDAQDGGKMLGSGELVRVLREWQSGRMTTERFNAWILAAELRDVDDWRESAEGSWSLQNDILWNLRSFMHSPPPAGDETSHPCQHFEIVRTHANDLLRLFRWPLSEEEGRDGIDTFVETLKNDIEQLGC